MSLVGYQVALLRPRSVRIASTSGELVRAVVRNLACGGYRLIVETEALRREAADLLGLNVEVRDQASPPADCAVFPFSLGAGSEPEGESSVVVVCHNGVSYKSLLRPGRAGPTVGRTIGRLEGRYRVGAVGGLFSPRCIWWLALATLAGRLSSPLQLWLEGRALAHLVERGPLWRFSYVVVLAGRSLD
jgi:hypothetical protein